MPIKLFLVYFEMNNNYRRNNLWLYNRRIKKILQYDYGYRIVYFYIDRYYIGEYCKSIEGFMIGFGDSDPIMEENDISKFVSNDDLLIF